MKTFVIMALCATYAAASQDEDVIPAVVDAEIVDAKIDIVSAVVDAEYEAAVDAEDAEN